MTAVDAAADLELRGQLSRLNALLVLSMLMTESTDEQQIIRLGASAAPSFAACRLVGVFTHDGQNTVWTPGDDKSTPPPAIQDLPTDGGAVDIPGSTWAWAYSLGGISTSLGHMVVAADQEVNRDGRFLLRVLAQQIGTALRNSRLHQLERTAAEQLASVNSRLESTVQALAQRMEIHDRLTRAAVSGEGMEGIANAVHEVTGLPVILEDRFGNLRAWAGLSDPPSVSKDPPVQREELLQRLLREGHSIWESGRVMCAASPRPDSVGVIALVDPDRTAREEDLVALEYGATIFSMELARLRTFADTEVRLRRDLVEDLLAGTGGESAVQRGEVFRHDLNLPHRVVVFEGRGRMGGADKFFTSVRRAARDFGLGSLLVARAGTVVLLTDRDVNWDDVQATVVRELGGGDCRIGVGGLTHGPDDFPTSHRNAVLALNLISGKAGDHAVVAFDDLGVYRLLASTQGSSEIEQFMKQWLGPLLEYDERRNSDLVLTLYRYLECGGRYDETAEALLIHRSTLRYRLQRIRDISQLPIGEADVNFNLQLACRAWSTRRALKSPGWS